MNDLYVIYIRYRDNRPCAHTGKPVTSLLPSYFYDSEDELGPTDCITLAVPGADGDARDRFGTWVAR
jgi:hypothetical protein